MDSGIDSAAAARGFLIESNVLSRRECDALLEAIVGGGRRNGRAGVRNLMGTEAVRSISADSRLVSVACPFLGKNAIPYRATLFEKSSRANWLVAWHQDTVLPLEKRVESLEWGPWSTKDGVLYAHAPSWALQRVIALRIQLDDSTECNGPLRVVPGTHDRGVLPVDEVMRVAHSSETVDCIASKGSVIAMRPLLIHGSSKVEKDLPRRVLHIEYVDTLALNEQIKIVLA